MKYQLKTLDDVQYIDEGNGPVLLLLHGLFGALSNWADVIEEFRKDYRVIIPMMPIYQVNLDDLSVETLADYIAMFVDKMQLSDLSVMGNSLGGHVGLVYTLEHPEKVRTLILTGSSGLFESGMGGSFPKRGSMEYIKERVEYTFYDPKTATQDLVDEVFEIVNNPKKAIRIIKIARAAQRHNLKVEIRTIQCPTLLIWGLNDNITPPEVAHEFHRLIPNSELYFIDHCGHAPMMERPKEFNAYLRRFLNKHLTVSHSF
ncbi:MAG: alpha/beta hydrolase [Bacteroidia bacterium]|nr:alpha/beta hydrolase [Bacteroidia bacterium]MDW8346578.1 alpha/beta hydrolase [Bacteroidia bacterium]